MHKFLIFIALLLPSGLLAQDSLRRCRDVVRVRGGSVYTGRVLHHNDQGMLVIQTWSGTEARIPVSDVRRVVQRCDDDVARRMPLAQKPYAFPERGWYSATRAGVLVASGEGESGPGLQHSMGFRFNRWLSAGLGLGLENFSPGNVSTTYPVFAEIRGYMLPRNLSPYYALGAGWGFSDRRNMSDFEGGVSRWEGGWMAQGELGYRVGNHFLMYLGLRFQRQYRHFENPWGWWSNGNGDRGTERHLRKRLQIGIGILL
jgi:hypothetical protein